jgi:hypothetical protein
MELNAHAAKGLKGDVMMKDARGRQPGMAACAARLGRAAFACP